MESWMINVAIAFTGVVATYSVLRNRVTRTEQDLVNHAKEEKASRSDLDRRMNAQFKRIDELTNRCTILEQDGINHLNIETAEARFVSKYELSLILKNIELESKHTSKTVDKIEGKLEELVTIFSHQQESK